MNIKYILGELTRLSNAPGSELMEIKTFIDGKYGAALKLETEEGPMEEGKVYVSANILGRDLLLVKEKELIIFQVDNSIPFPSPSQPD